jgi:hypothetical protein
MMVGMNPLHQAWAKFPRWHELDGRDKQEVHVR